MISLIAALDAHGGIGYQGELLERIPSDLMRFRKLTMGKPVIVGRPTYEGSMRGEPLPGRITIVLTRDERWSANGVTVAHSLEDAYKAAEASGASEIFVAGGAHIYEQALQDADRAYLTLIETAKPADAFFPKGWEMEFDERIYEEPGIWKGIRYRFVVDQRG